MEYKRCTDFFRIAHLFLIAFTVNVSAQEKKVLFIGNSYTDVNNLPQMFKDVAGSTGDIIVFDSNTPGGHTFQLHSQNTTTLNKIAAGNWDFVVLQEQSQRPALTENHVVTYVYPFAQQLNNAIIESSPCAETVFYMTWGRKNGDASNCEFWPPICTYEGMDDLLYERYMAMGEQNDAIVSPVGAVWKYLRQNHPEIELYQADESHPSSAGTYAAACTFYATILRKNPLDISFNSTLTQSQADIIKAAAKTVAFDSLSDWMIGDYDPVAAFAYNTAGAVVSFTEQAQNEETFFWDFGDGHTSIEPNPEHTYNATGDYSVTLTVTRCGVDDVISQTVSITTLGNKRFNENQDLICYPTLVSDKVNIRTAQNIRQVYLIDLSGRIVDLPFSSEADEVSVDLSSYASATYFLKAVTDSESFTTKIVKQ